jgi:hypothetical protein
MRFTQSRSWLAQVRMSPQGFHSGNESRFSERMGALMRKHITALVEGSPMQRKIGFAFVAAAIGAMIALGLAGTGAKETERASASLVVQALRPVW